MNQNKEFTIFINKKPSELTDSELVTEIKKRIDNNSIEISVLTQLFIEIGKIQMEHPELYLKVIAEVKNKRS